MLFSFANGFDDCPDSLYLLRGFKPEGVDGNEVLGYGVQNGDEFPVPFGKTYDHKAAACGTPITTVPGNTDDILLFAGGGNSDFLALAPNPADGYVKVGFSTENTDKQVLVRLLNLHGQSMQRHLAAGQNQLKLDLNGLPAGLYFVTLEVDGKVRLRERLVKK